MQACLPDYDSNIMNQKPKTFIMVRTRRGRVWETPHRVGVSQGSQVKLLLLWIYIIHSLNSAIIKLIRLLLRHDLTRSLHLFRLELVSLIKILFPKSSNFKKMCTNKILIRNNSSYIDLYHSVRSHRYVNCGWCSECMQAKMNESQVRLHYHSMECLNKGGYLLIDCLTYAPEYCPYISRFVDVPMNYNYKCFDSHDVRLFNERLTTKLNRLGYKNAYTYWYVGEFGTKNTKRPHYHIIFFVTAPVPNWLFSLYVSDCWYLGLTDGLRYKGVNNLQYNTISKESPESRIAAISSYLSKYLHKSQKLIQDARRKTLNIFRYLHGFVYESDLNYQQRLEWLFIIKHFRPFSKYSKGFGLYAVSCVGLEYINKYKSIYFMQDKFKFEIPLPQYFARKLFYQCVKNEYTCNYSWIPKKEGFQFRINSILDSVRTLAKDFNLVCPESSLPPIYFSLLYHFVFGRFNYQSMSQSLFTDLNINALNCYSFPGVYNYTHPKYQLNCYTTHVLLYNHVKQIKRRKKLKNEVSKFYYSPKTPNMVFNQGSIEKTYSAVSENVLSKYGFHALCSLYFRRKSKFHSQKLNAFDLKDSIYRYYQSLKLNCYV